LTPGIADKPDTHVSLCPRGPFHDCLTLRRRRLSRTGAVLRRMRTAKTLPGPLSRADVSIGPGRQALRQLRRGDHVQPDGAWSRQAVKVSADPGSLHAPRREGVAAEAVGHRPEDGVVALQCRLHRVRGRPPHKPVDPSMSVNRNVTVPEGAHPHRHGLPYSVAPAPG